MYLTTKISAWPTSPRSIINVFAYLLAAESASGNALDGRRPAPDSYYVSEEEYYTLRARMMKHETIILRTLGFQLHISLPYVLCINYLQALEVFHNSSGKRLAGRAFEYLNSLLLSPQLVYLTHQPSALATSAIYLAAKETGVKLPEEEWWEVFDTDREELGFLVVAMTSMESFALEEKTQWGNRKVPLNVEEVEAELERRRLLETSEQG